MLSLKHENNLNTVYEECKKMIIWFERTCTTSKKMKKCYLKTYSITIFRHKYKIIATYIKIIFFHFFFSKQSWK